MGLMNSSEQGKFLAHLQRYYQRCPICGNPGGEVEPEVCGMPVFDRAIPAGIGPTAGVMLAILVTCRTCKHMSLFQAKSFVEAS
jgi:hypothetical protein